MPPAIGKPAAAGLKVQVGAPSGEAVPPFGVTLNAGAAAIPLVTSVASATIVTVPALAGLGVMERMFTTGGVASTVKATVVSGVWLLPATSVARTVRT